MARLNMLPSDHSCPTKRQYNIKTKKTNYRVRHNTIHPCPTHQLILWPILPNSEGTLLETLK